jgi:hypothetical protein
MISKKILFVSANENSASTRYRALNYFSHMRQAGWQPEYFALRQNPLTRALLLKKAAEAHAVVVLRKTFSGFYPKLLRSAAKILIFDFDDAIFMRSNCEPSRTRMKRFERLVEVCDQVWAGNRYLANQQNAATPPWSLWRRPSILKSMSRLSPNRRTRSIWFGSVAARQKSIFSTSFLPWSR